MRWLSSGDVSFLLLNLVQRREGRGGRERGGKDRRRNRRGEGGEEGRGDLFSNAGTR